MPVTYKKIASVTLGSSQSSIAFTSIDQTFTDLVLKTSIRTDSGGDYQTAFITLNGTNTYTIRRLFGYDSNLTASDSATNKYYLIATASGATASTFASNEVIFPNYTGTTNKSLSVDGVAENNSSTSWFVQLNAGLVTLTSAITSITLQPNGGGNFVANSTATLYGISKS